MRSTSGRASIAAAALVAVLLPTLLAGCGSGSAGAKPGTTGPVADLGEPTDLTGQAEITVEVVDNAFVPRVVRVSPGTKIIFKNTGINVHNVTPYVEGELPTLDLNPGKSGTIVAPQGATPYRFYCTLHARTDGGVQRGAMLVAAP